MSAAQAGVYDKKLGIRVTKTVVRGCQSTWSAGRERSEKDSTANQIIKLK